MLIKSKTIYVYFSSYLGKSIIKEKIMAMAELHLESPHTIQGSHLPTKTEHQKSIAADIQNSHAPVLDSAEIPPPSVEVVEVQGDHVVHPSTDPPFIALAKKLQTATIEEKQTQILSFLEKEKITELTDEHEKTTILENIKTKIQALFSEMTTLNEEINQDLSLVATQKNKTVEELTENDFSPEQKIQFFKKYQQLNLLHQTMLNLTILSSADKYKSIRGRLATLLFGESATTEQISRIPAKIDVFSLLGIDPQTTNLPSFSSLMDTFNIHDDAKNPYRELFLLLRDTHKAVSNSLLRDIRLADLKGVTIPSEEVATEITVQGTKNRKMLDLFRQLGLDKPAEIKSQTAAQIQITSPKLTYLTKLQTSKTVKEKKQIVLSLVQNSSIAFPKTTVGKILWVLGNILFLGLPALIRFISRPQIPNKIMLSTMERARAIINQSPNFETAEIKSMEEYRDSLIRLSSMLSLLSFPDYFRDLRNHLLKLVFEGTTPTEKEKKQFLANLPKVINPFDILGCTPNTIPASFTEYIQTLGIEDNTTLSYLLREAVQMIQTPSASQMYQALLKGDKPISESLKRSAGELISEISEKFAEVSRAIFDRTSQ